LNSARNAEQGLARATSMEAEAGAHATLERDRAG
jgi:hypothetical protein